MFVVANLNFLGLLINSYVGTSSALVVALGLAGHGEAERNVRCQSTRTRRQWACKRHHDDSLPSHKVRGTPSQGWDTVTIRLGVHGLTRTRNRGPGCGGNAVFHRRVDASVTVFTGDRVSFANWNGHAVVRRRRLSVPWLLAATGSVEVGERASAVSDMAATLATPADAAKMDLVTVLHFNADNMSHKIGTWLLYACHSGSAARLADSEIEHVQCQHQPNLHTSHPQSPQ